MRDFDTLRYRAISAWVYPSSGKHTTQAQIAVMRKMVITAHSLYKNNRRYDVDLNTKKAEDVA